MMGGWHGKLRVDPIFKGLSLADRFDICRQRVDL